MLYFWLRVVISALRETLAFIGRSKGGILFDAIVIVVTAYRLYKKHGLHGMSEKVWEALGESVLIALAAGVIVFTWMLIHVPAEMLATANQTVTQERFEIADQHLATTTCKNSLEIEATTAHLLEGQRDSQQQTINSQQGQLDSSQGTINSCVVSLGKMNPLVSRKTEAYYIQVAVNKVPGAGRFSPPVPTYLGLIVITTNQRADPTGIVKCERPFSPNPPMPTDTRTEVFSAPIQPRRISDNEYAIKVGGLGFEWNPNSPIFLLASSPTPSPGSCSFIPD